MACACVTPVHPPIPELTRERWFLWGEDGRTETRTQGLGRVRQAPYHLLLHPRPHAAQVAKSRRREAERFIRFPSSQAPPGPSPSPNQTGIWTVCGPQGSLLGLTLKLSSQAHPLVGQLSPSSFSYQRSLEIPKPQLPVQITDSFVPSIARTYCVGRGTQGEMESLSGERACQRRKGQ